MRIAVFVENRNGVGLTSRIMSATGAGEHTFLPVTADLDGDVGRWIDEEASSRLGGRRVHNLFREGEALTHAQFLEETGPRISEFARSESVDRLILFNDRSQRGSRVADALSGTLPVVLVQDGHLDFHYKKLGPGLRDQNWYYGSSGPAAVCVWGPATAHHLLYRTADADPVVHVTGALGHSDDPDLVRAAHQPAPPTARPSREPLRIILLDQPLGDQRKLPANQHREYLRTACEALAEFGEVSVKPHPSTLSGHLDWLATLPGITVLDESTLVDAAGLEAFDLAVTFFSTTYLQTLRAGVPLVLFSPPPLNIVFPAVNHALLRNVGSVGELADVVGQLHRTGKFAGNNTGEPLTHFLTFHDDVAERILTVVEEAKVRAPRVAPGPGETSPAPVGTRAERALRAVRDQQAPPRSMAVVGLGFGYTTGVAIPVLTYTQALLAQSPVDVRYLDLSAYCRTEDVLDALGDTDVVLVNSLAPLWRSALGNELVDELVSAGRKVFLYAHETEHVMAYEAEHHTLRHKEMLRLLPRVRVLCVSSAQADMFRGLGVTAPVVVYNTVPQDSHRVRARPTPGGQPRIVMVGSMQDRKGLDLFSRVAELAHAKGLPWRFAWIGHRTPRIASSTLVSDRVTWMGALSRARVREELAASDVFFLSSVDDPMPLSVVEAVQQRLRVITYGRVGSREVLDGVPGYRSFSEYTPQAAFDALRSVLAERVSEDDYREVEELFDIPAFTARMTTALGLPGPGPARYPLSAASVSSAASAESAESEETADGDGPENPRAVIPQQLRHLNEDFKRHVGAGNVEDALRVGTEILRRRQPVDVLIGMAELRAARGQAKEACRLLAAAAVVGGDRGRVWSEISRVAALLGPRGRAIRQLARKESVRAQVTHHSARLRKGD
ncbi:glycosyltransferase family 4 protein [Streptomyces sp. NPDC057238]|uniref:glycosyltransferase family 4 protein n=1 Tax=Streptomyces sp. NPDC057238 TaxID=3346060 RepID=UPI00363AA00B